MKKPPFYVGDPMMIFLPSCNDGAGDRVHFEIVILQGQRLHR